MRTQPSAKKVRRNGEMSHRFLVQQIKEYNHYSEMNSVILQAAYRNSIIINSTSVDPVNDILLTSMCWLRAAPAVGP